MLSAALLASAIAVSAFYGSGKEPAVQTISAQTPDSAEKTEDEMKGVWITYMELGMEHEKDKSEKAFTRKFEAIAETCKSFGFNTLIVQVRPFCDALYKSSYFPYSHVLTGVQGKNPGYDPLSIMCRVSRENNMKIHAWVNPYRISYNNVPKKLCGGNPYIRDKSLGIETDSTLFLNPSSEKAQALIENGVAELVKNYDIDGVQFDDYFYPPDTENEDIDSYNNYRETSEGEVMSLEEWRKANINLLMARCFIAVHKNGNNAVFGISPQGNLENNAELFADVKSWCAARGYCDYICPQIYFSLDNPALGFEEALNEWCALDLNGKTRLYAGLAGYKAGTDDDEGTWEYSDNVLSSEYNILKKNNKVSGIMLYSYSSLINDEAKKEMNNLKKQLYSKTPPQ